VADSLDDALARVGDRWTLAVVRALLDGPRRYSDLAAHVAGIAPNTLADRLRRLERDGLVLARLYCERPPRFEYELTADGRELAPAIEALAAWGARHTGSGADDDEAPIRV
jgi:DNA-binding HxlR family transcriptional regulator